MPEYKQLTCIVCPIGCRLKITVQDSDVNVEGHACLQGVDYGKSEALDPRRTITSSVLVIGGRWPLVSVRTSVPVPKGRIFDVMAAIKRAKVQGPVEMGDVLIKDVAGTGADILATKYIALE